MDNRGQLSAEYILIVGFLLAVILIFAVYVSDQTEQNTIATATRLGAVNASAEIGIMNRNITPIRVTKVEMTDSENIINIVVFLSNSPSDISQKQSILTGIQQSIESQGYPVNNAGNNLTLNTSKHNYLIRLS
ncbi:MAG TPA: class III signal peptide-containing protein [Methanobacterium subterraneum]|uniref:Class III signal peptide-containing protein n=1 Tax=Methanobacterium subterraneum TaxID=59277 RepID=A0A7J4TK31_9EURY|nr:class III signal peptide-containing protein [Methanobacterium subterraneum]